MSNPSSEGRVKCQREPSVDRLGDCAGEWGQTENYEHQPAAAERRLQVPLRKRRMKRKCSWPSMEDDLDDLSGNPSEQLQHNGNASRVKTAFDKL